MAKYLHLGKSGRSCQSPNNPMENVVQYVVKFNMLKSLGINSLFGYKMRIASIRYMSIS